MSFHIFGHIRKRNIIRRFQYDFRRQKLATFCRLFSFRTSDKETNLFQRTQFLYRSYHNKQESLFKKKHIYQKLGYQISQEVPQGYVLGPIIFDIYLNHLFYFLSCEVCNFADNATVTFEIRNQNLYSLNQKIIMILFPLNGLIIIT